MELSHKLLLLAWFYFTSFAIVGGEFYDLYNEIYWYDLALHYLAGILLTLSVLYVFKPSSKVVFILVGSLVTNFLVMWEVFEFFMDTYLDLNMQKDGIKDTMEDILVGKLGCLTTLPFTYKRFTGVS